MTILEFSNIISTLVINGFHIKQVQRFSPENSIIDTYKYDKLGAEIRYSILFSSDVIETPILKTLNTVSRSYQSQSLLINDHFTSVHHKCYSSKKFFEFFGGIVNTGLILIPNLSDILYKLGHNKLPTGLAGEPEDLHELYVSECFQYILESPTRRYGSDRLFEKLPDGLIMCKNKFMILFDSKSYTDGFDIKSDDINRFAFYVSDFNNRYADFFGSIFSFIIVSGHFNDSDKSISNRSSELYKLCNTKLSCITSKELGNIVQLLHKNSEYRISINWKNIFSNLIIETKFVQKEIIRIRKDKLL
jgi:hypothetical protein